MLKEDFKEITDRAFEMDEKIENIVVDFEGEIINDEYVNIDFYKSTFKGINILETNFEKVSFVNCEFENCNFSNANFENVSFIRTKFKNCKFTGTVFLKSRFDNVEYTDSNLCYSNFSLGTINGLTYKDSVMRNMYFEENKHKNLVITNCDLTSASFFKTKLKDVDLSSDIISGLIIGFDDIRGALIDPLQATDLVGLLGVKFK